MKASWTQGLPPEQVEILKQDYKSSSHLRERLTKLLNNKIESSRTKCRSTNTYENPNWNLIQADAIGYEKALYEVISLIS